LELILA